MIWISNLNTRDSRLLALIVLGAVIWVMFSFVIAPLITVQTSINADIDHAQKRLDRLNAVVLRIEQSRTGTKQKLPTTTWIGSSASVIAAKVQKEVQSAALTNGVTIVSISQTKSRYDETIKTVGLVVEGHGEIASFVDFFSILERHQPLLFIDGLMLRRYQATPGLVPGARLPLSTRFEIHAPLNLEVDE